MGLFGAIYNAASSLYGSNEDPDPREFYRPTTKPPVPRTLQGENLIVILVMGRSGCGKTSLIETFCSPNSSGVIPRYQSTAEAHSRSVDLSETRFRFIDTPGFDNVGLNDAEVCTRVAEYFGDKRRYHLGVNGIIYIHQAGDPLRSRSLHRYLTVLSRVLLGKVGMPRLTIFIPHIDPQGLSAMQITEHLGENNTILTEAKDMGTRFVCGGGLEGFANIAKTYKPMTPVVLPIQDYTSNLASELESILHEKPRRQNSSKQEAQLSAYQQKVDELHSALEIKESQVAKYKGAYNQVKNLHATQQDTEAALRQQLKQIQHEYSSLRSELQLQENFEQSEIVQELEDLNRQIDDISRTISAHLTDNHVGATFGREPTEVTALDARNLPELLKMLDYDGGKCSLVSSANGEGLDIESFLDFTIRDMLCALLAKTIFEPFHPGIDSEQSDTLSRAYEDIQKRESQTKSGKWRSSTFKSIFTDDNPDRITNWIHRLLALFARMRLNPLITCVFGSKDAALDRKHFNQMHELVKRAWDWNAKLKGEVIVLGDFRLTLHAPYTDFDPNTMKDFEPQPRKQSTFVLGTVGLGLISLRAIGAGQPPEETLVCKTTVTTDTLYA